MKSVFKKLFVFVFVLLIIGFFFCVYVMQAPPVAERGQPKLQVHVRTAVRGRPTVNSGPIATTKNSHLYSLDRTYLSNLNSSILSGELLFNVVLGVRAKYNAPLLDKEVSTGFDWQKMFADSAVGIRLKSKTPKIKVTLSGQGWLLTDSTGAGYSIQKTGDKLEIFLPDLLEAFDLNSMILSNDFEFTVVKPGKQWLITDNKYQQSYELRSDAKKINVYQYPKYPIQTLLFEVDSDPQLPLPEEKLPDEIYKGFKGLDIPLSSRAKVMQGKDDVSWKITDDMTNSGQKYTIRHEDNRLKVYLDLDSRWLLLKVNNRINAWVQSERGTIFMPREPTLTSRQQLKKDMLAFFAKLKNRVGISDQNDP